MSQVQFLKLQNVQLKHDSEIQRKELELRVKEVETREARNELEWRNRLAEKENVTILYFDFICSISIERRKTDSLVIWYHGLSASRLLFISLLACLV